MFYGERTDGTDLGTRQKAMQIGLVRLLPAFEPLLPGMVLWSNHDRTFLSGIRLMSSLATSPFPAT